MMPRLLVIAVLALASASSAQTDAPKSAATGAAASPADKEKARQIIGELQRLNASQKFFEALEKLNELEALRPTDAMVHNVRGSIYTNMRDYEKARASFLKAQSMNPVAFEPRFNLTELSYVQGDYQGAEAGFTKILTEFPTMATEVRRLTQFKIIVCQLKRNKVTEAGASLKAFAFPEDSEARYFSEAAFAFQKGDKAAASGWVEKARKIFKPMQGVPYLDTLMEARWIPSLTVPDDPKK